MALLVFGDGVGVARLRKFVSLIGEEMFSDESLDDDEFTWMVLFKQHGLTLILAVFLMGLEDSDEVLDFVIARLGLARITSLREVKVMV